MPTQTFTRATGTLPDLAVLYPAVVAVLGNQFLLVLDFRDDGSKLVRIDRGSAWTSQEIADVQAAVTNAPASSAPLISPDAFPLVEKAILLTILDETNRLRAALRGLGVTGLPNIDTQTMIGAVRTKAGSL